MGVRRVTKIKSKSDTLVRVNMRDYQIVLRILLPVAMISFAIVGGAFEVFGDGCYPYGCEAHALDVIELWKPSQSLALDQYLV